ncbi:MAG: insulinase family protein [Candidatus Dormibacteraeota bacterium]|nr:insulinase family protein [Candidatus Dormibacteraeota bacterium]
MRSAAAAGADAFVAGVADRGYTRTVLDGGVRLLAAPMRERASVSIAFMFGTGSRVETADECGLAHFIEHMVFKGGQTYPTARRISEAVEGVGGVLNASTDREATIFWSKVPADRVDVAVSVLADMLFTPRFLPEDIDRERQVVIEELRMYEDSPQDHVHTLFDAVMWPDHPLGWDVAGTEATVQSFTTDDCRRHLQRHYRRDDLVVSVAGALDADAIAALVSGALQGWLGDGRNGAQPRPATAPTGAAVSLLDRRASQANIVLGARAPSYRDERRFVADILNVVLGEGMSSRLFLELREERALAYDVHSFLTRVADSGTLAISLGCEPKRALEAMRAAVAELERLATEPVPLDELERAKEYARGRLAVQLESTSALCNHLGQQELLTGEILLADDIAERLLAVDPDAVRSLAAEILAGGLRAAVIGPFRKLEPFLEALHA